MGSFDPPHIGHISIVTNALNSGYVDKMLVVPAFKNLWKETTTPFISRYDMCEKAFDPFGNKVEVSMAEYYLSFTYPDGVPSYYTIECIKEDLKEYSVYLVTTLETYKSIEKWKFGERILNENEFLIIDTKTGDPALVDIVIPEIMMSSTYIRNELANCNEVYPYITKEVRDYINKFNLYTK